MTNPAGGCNRCAWVRALVLLLQLATVKTIHAAHALQASSFECDGSSPQNRSCLLRNVYFWDQTIYFLTKGGPKDKAPPAIDVRLPYGESGLSNPVRTISFKEAAEVLMNDGHADEGDGDMTPVDKAVVWFRSRPHNIYHLLWEILPGIHMQACRWFKKCSYKHKDGLQLIFVDKQVTASVRAFSGAARCLSSMPYWEMGRTPSSPILVKQLVVGTGEENLIQVGGWLGPGRKRAGKPLFLQWQARMKACLGLAPLTTVQQVQPPVVTILQRPYDISRGRSFVNLNEVVPALKKLAPDFKWQVVGLADNVSFADQAYTFSNSSIIISSHGAQLSHLMWLRKGAVIVEVDQFGAESNAFFLRHLNLMQSTNPVKHVRYTPHTPMSTALRKADLAQLSYFKNQKNVTMDMFSGMPRCQYWFPKEPSYHCSLWIKYYADIRLEKDNLVDTVREAVRLLREQ